MWSVRLERALAGLGHEPVASTGGIPDGPFDAAVVNLGQGGTDWPALVQSLHDRSMLVVGHAGHKEKDLHELGKLAGCDLLATNAELTMKLASVLSRVEALSGSQTAEADSARMPGQALSS